MLALVVEPGVALGTMLPLLMVMDAATLGPYWRKWSWPDARLLIVGGVVGTAIGAGLWRLANADLLRLLIGFIALAFVVWQTAGARGWIRIGEGAVPPWGGTLAGVVAGFTSFVSHAGGPPAAIYLLARRLDKTTYQATTVLTFWAINIATVVPYAMLGIFTAETLTADLLLAPVALAGAWLGVRAHRLVPERAFFAVMYALLTLTGIRLIWDALT
jgi:uncharacterized membrane protein YfcA